jgi:multisubunit Na+/H+ antiporter MnhB subunit
MSALSGSPRTLEDSPPRLSKLLGAVLGGEVLAAVTLWVACIILTIVGLAPMGGAEQWVWLPWQIDGVWALVGAVGWGYLVCTLVAVLVSDGITRRGYEKPDATWLRIAIAISGYGAMAAGGTAGGRIGVAVIAGAVVIRYVAFTHDGTARRWRWRMTSRAQLLTVLVAALVGFSYSALHPFAADGSGGTYGTGPIAGHIGHTEEVDVGLSSSRLATQITGVTLTGPGAVHFKVSKIIVGGDANPYGSDGLQATRLPSRQPAGHGIWISAEVRLTSCGDASVNTLRLHYRMLGIGTTEIIRLQDPLRLSCTP